MYTVITDFVDIKDENHIYRTGDKFPRDGADASMERLAELSSTRNRCGVVLIKKLVERADISPVKDENKASEESVAKTEKKPKKQKKKE